MHQVLDLGRFALESGADLPEARLAYTTHGVLNAAGDNAVLVPSYYTGTHASAEPWIGAGRALDPAEWFIVSVDLFGNGVSTSPSNAVTEVRGAAFPTVSIGDNVRAQHRLAEQLGVRRWRLVVGWSMGALQAYEWAVRYPELIDAFLPIAGAARCSPHNAVFLAGVEAALRADKVFEGGRYAVPPRAGLRAFGTVYAGWAYSQAFFRDGVYRELGYPDVDALLEDWAADHERWDANDLLAMLRTWQQADPGRGVDGGLAAALGGVRARSIVMPSSTDLYFTVEDNVLESAMMSRSEVRVIRSDLGHVAGRPGVRAAETTVIEAAMRELLADR
ncbi:alpha/beta fold hydrolase [Plantibacter sp. VKM Ac-2880]|uniref:alpha/beta fold hydrolase n=1 Tax=Plantibacter sp. VKM Ac-2880 TaxID=2783827 RepID=UPI001890760D|nr:alpha/beta fold hydrolase [Plantibacter sp. VKM Ac-2880]MBF4567576.1 alpha/beta fold hydrolase [Plantibacter sp. VKM Ac-2880]